ncbi:MAG: aminotransferase class I/II-fold pyridoxal phosphate-dependent enzyme [Pseudomonadota bacterium]|nr:aminotransferase class I/II-fold pyridoxal phosphate-dependent enzyme [Pseudomonadota bacterium]
MREANRLESRGAEVLHLEVGQPSTSAPKGVLQAAKRKITTDRLGYTDALGIPRLRERITEHYNAKYGLSLNSDCVVVTTGSSGGFMLAFLSAFDAGDRVVLATPGYPAYRNILNALDIKTVEVPCAADNGYKITPAVLDRIKTPIDGLIVASPANPTGTMLTSDDINAIASYCDDRKIRLISDEIYHGITYASAETTALSYTENAFIINSFSKYYSMTGWRVGWVVVPEKLLRSVECLAQNIYISVPSISQHAACVAFDCINELDKNVHRYAVNRDFLLSELPKIGVDQIAPADGAFYLYAGVEEFTYNSVDFCRRLLTETGIALAPGVDFDPDAGHLSVRISFSGETKTIVEAMSRFGEWVTKLDARI